LVGGLSGWQQWWVLTLAHTLTIQNAKSSFCHQECAPPYQIECCCLTVMLLRVACLLHRTARSIGIGSVVACPNAPSMEERTGPARARVQRRHTGVQPVMLNGTAAGGDIPMDRLISPRFISSFNNLESFFIREGWLGGLASN